MQERKSSRDIPLTELYTNLQLEYLSYFVRAKIYCRDFAEKYGEARDKKREKIDLISSRNGLPSIFNDESTKERYLKEFLNEYGTPNFTYKDEAIRNKMERWDRNYYFCKGTSVKLHVDTSVILGIVLHNDKNQCILTIIDEFKNQHQVHYNLVTRLFPEDFFNLI